MNVRDRGRGPAGPAYSWRRTLMFFVFAALLGWAGVFGAIYATLVVFDVMAPTDTAQQVDRLQKIAPAAGDPARR